MLDTRGVMFLVTIVNLIMQLFNDWLLCTLAAESVRLGRIRSLHHARFSA